MNNNYNEKSFKICGVDVHPIGTEVFFLVEKKTSRNCEICDATGQVKIKDVDLKCPSCNGKGSIKNFHKKSYVNEDSYKITRINAVVEIGKNPVIKYTIESELGRTLSFNSDRLFLLKSEAEEKCIEKNQTELLPIEKIAILQLYDKTNTSAFKIKKKLEHYEKNNEFDGTIIVNENNELIDGYINYYIAKMLGHSFVKVVRKIKEQ